MDSISSSESGSSSTSKETSFPIDPPPTPIDPPPTYFPEHFPYDVFLSFRGIDTRINFTEHLYDRLAMAGIRTFMDDDQLQTGREISLQLMKAIEESRIYIVVFSPNYGSSTWCLNELVKIKEKVENSGERLLYPVFYDVEPSDVRYQKGRFGTTLKYTFGKNTTGDFLTNLRSLLRPNTVRGCQVEVWKNALKFAANHSGFNLKRNALGSNSRLISQIIKELLVDVKPKILFIAKYPVGLESRVNDVYSLLSFETSNHVQLIGIWGMGGSGKSVIVKALFNKILYFFDSSCFLANIRADSLRYGLVHLQEKLISMLLMVENVTVSCIDEGIEMIKNRLRHKKVLIVLDDADKLDQIDALAGHRSWLGDGSVIIITTRDQHLLNQVQVDKRYEAGELNSRESLELFNWHSFRSPFTKETYSSIANEIISYCCGLPLALEVLGAFLFGRTVEQWNSAYNKLKRNPLPEIQKVLQISYDGLDYQEREIFLDIACFFTGKDIDYVTEILNGSNFSSEIGIGILRERCLLTVTKDNELRMHDLIREMGREIVFQPFPNDPGKRSRLWSYKDAKDVIMTNMGTNAVEGVTLVSPTKEEIKLTSKSFQKMHRLRLLQLDSVSIHGSCISIPDNIRYVSWQNCSWERLPSSLRLRNLVAFDMQHSNLRSVWPANTSCNVPRHLKILDLSHSKFLTSTPDFRLLRDLVTLLLEGCTSLLQIDPSIGCLDKLLVLNLKGCERIRNIPCEICNLRSLGYLNLIGCLNLKELPTNLGDIKYLRELYADETAITELPATLNQLTNLIILSLRKCANIDFLPIPIRVEWPIMPNSVKRDLELHVRRLNLRDCNLSDDDIPIDIGDRLCHLRELDLAGNRLHTLPWSFKRLINLESLWLDDWSILTSIANLPPNLEDLIAKNIRRLDE